MEYDYNLLSHEKLVDIWTEFLQRFTKDGKIGEGYYYKKIGHMRGDDTITLTFDCQDLADAITYQNNRPTSDGSFADFNILRPLILRDPDDAKITLREAVIRLLEERDPEYCDSVRNQLKAEFSDIPIQLEIRDLNRERVGSAVQIDGLVEEIEEIKREEIQETVFVCGEGHYTFRNNYDPPKNCAGYNLERSDTIDCDNKYFRTADKYFKIEDFIQFKIQQRPDRVKEQKSALDIEIDTIGRDNVAFVQDKLRFGDYVAVNGTVKLKKSGAVSSRGNPLADLYLELSSLEVKPESALAQDDETYKEMVKDAIHPETESIDYPKLLRSVCPNIRLPETDILKEAVLLLVVGSDSRIKRDGIRIRGDIFGLMLGDPGTAKSTIMDWVKQVRSRVIYTSGQKTSGVGLVGGLRIEDKTHKRIIVGGAFGLAGRDGIVELDELEKRSLEDMNTLAEPMSDQQTITIQKGGERKVQHISCGVLAAANPNTKTSRYDIKKDIFFNTKIPNMLLNRFDWIFVMRDVADQYEDLAKFRHIVKFYEGSVSEKEFTKGKHDFKKIGEDFYPITYMKHWIQYVRDNFHPKCTDSPDAMLVIEKFFMKYRRLNKRLPETEEEKENWSKDYEVPAIDVRQLHSLMRLAEARARAGHRNNVSVKDAETAVRIIEISLASSGFNQFATVTASSKQDTPDEMEVLNMKLQRKDLLEKRKAESKYVTIFKRVLKKVGWQKCRICDYGVRDDGDGKRACDYCNGRGGQEIPFDNAQLEDGCVYELMGRGKCREIFKTYVESGAIVPSGSLWMIARMKETDFVSSPLFPEQGEFVTADQIMKHNILRTEPSLAKDLESMGHEDVKGAILKELEDVEKASYVKKVKEQENPEDGL
jgi:replicative DNA helicase Mcm